MSFKGPAVALVIAGALGYGIGQSHARVETEYKVLHDTKTVTVHTPPEKIPGPPPADCLDMAATARDIMKAGAKYDVISAELIDSISDIRYAAAEHDSFKANEVETRVRHLDAATIGASEIFAESKTNLRIQYNNCTKGLEYSR